MNLVLKKFLWKWIYRFNGRVLFFIPGITIASTKLYVEKDEYCTLRADGWVVIRSKSEPKYTDMLPVYLISESTVNLLLYSIGKDPIPEEKDETETKT